jgi:hypothetical protein
MPRRFTLICLVVAALSPTRPAWAHNRTTTVQQIAVDHDGVTWNLKVRAIDLLAPLGLDEKGAPAAIRDRLAQAARFVEGGVAVRAGTHACAPSSAPPVFEPTTEPTVAFAVRFDCGEFHGPRTLTYSLFFDLDPLHRGLAQIQTENQPRSLIFRHAEREVALTTTAPAWQQFADYLLLGIEHIFTGYDHLAFLAALILGATHRRTVVAEFERPSASRDVLRDTIKIVTGFTVAHSLTLAWAALRPGVVPTFWVEPVIALSVVFVAIENLRVRAPRRRWVPASLFGLVHGFGFASVLQEVGLPPGGLVRALFAFNLGVELGQLAVAAAVLPLLLLGARVDSRRYERWVLRGGSIALAVAGAAWFLSRI